MTVNGDIFSLFMATSVEQTDNYQKLRFNDTNQSDKDSQGSQIQTPQDQVIFSKRAEQLIITPENKKCNCGKCQACLSQKEREEADLSKEDQQKIEELRRRDLEVRQHEQAHVSAGASSPSYEYETGPDGKRYAVGGDAKIETSEESTPRKTIEKAQKIKRAALAPSKPSSQDRKIAAEAEKMEAKARQELAKEKIEGHKTHLDGISAEEISSENNSPIKSPKNLEVEISNVHIYNLNSTFKGSTLDITV